MLCPATTQSFQKRFKSKAEIPRSENTDSKLPLLTWGSKGENPGAQGANGSRPRRSRIVVHLRGGCSGSHTHAICLPRHNQEWTICPGHLRLGPEISPGFPGVPLHCPLSNFSIFVYSQCGPFKRLNFLVMSTLSCTLSMQSSCLAGGCKKTNSAFLHIMFCSLSPQSPHFSFPQVKLIQSVSFSQRQ